MYKIFLVFYFLFFSSNAFADFSGKVVHIADGDTITVLNSANEEKKIRLNGVDCPEKGQAFANKAKEFVKDLIAGKIVTVQAHDNDIYGRIIGDVILEDGRNLNRELIKAGYAWWFFKYSDDEHLGILEVKAKIAKVGLWKDKNPIPPWIFRHRDKLATLPARAPPEAIPEITTPSDPSTSLPILGNRRSRIYHRTDCPNYDDISPKNRVPFDSAQYAENAGYRLARNCPK